MFADTDPNALGQIWVFILFPLVGAIIGVVAWLVIDETRLEDTLLVEVPGAAVVRDAAAEIDQAID